ncbi:MAG: hypothetical protein FWD35_01775 [Oscillospiraceae bacterium]|nr:hypothetical protein [Oscillospiraceae bacterium]
MGVINGITLFALPLLIAAGLFTAASVSHKRVAARRFAAGLLALVSAASVLADVRMSVIAAATVATIVLARVFLKCEIVPLRTFAICAGVFAAVLVALGVYGAFGLHEFGFFISFSLYDLVGNLYRFALSTWGAGVLGLCVFVRHLLIRREAVAENVPKNFMRFSILAMFALLAAVFASFGSVGCLEIATPLVLFVMVCGVFTHGLNLRTILTGVTVLGAIFAAYFTTTAAGLTDSQLMHVSIMFSFMGLLIALVSCGGRRQTRIIATSIALVTAVALYNVFGTAAG